MPIEAIDVPVCRKANKALLAEWFGVSIATVDAWVRRGCPSVQRGEKGRPWIFDLKEVAAWRFGVYERGQPDGFDPGRMDPKDRLDYYRSERERLKMEQETGDLIPAVEVERVAAEVLKSIAQTLDTLPDVLERDAGISPDAVLVVQRVIDAARESMFGDLQQIAPAMEGG